MSHWTPWDWIAYACLGISATGVAMASLPKDTKTMVEGWSGFFRSKRWSFVPAIFFVLATIIFIIRIVSISEGNVSPASGSSAKQRREIVNSLAKLVDEGTQFQYRFSTDSIPTRSELDDWGKRVQDVLSKPVLGDGYVARFNSSASFRGVYLPNQPTDRGERVAWLDERVSTLREFIKELSDTSRD